MQELSKAIGANFKRKLQYKLLFIWRDHTRVMVTRAMLQPLEPFIQAAIFSAAWNDTSTIGNLVRRACVPDEDSEMLEDTTNPDQ